MVSDHYHSGELVMRKRVPIYKKRPALFVATQWSSSLFSFHDNAPSVSRSGFRIAISSCFVVHMYDWSNERTFLLLGLLYKTALRYPRHPRPSTTHSTLKWRFFSYCPPKKTQKFLVRWICGPLCVSLPARSQRRTMVCKRNARATWTFILHVNLTTIGLKPNTK